MFGRQYVLPHDICIISSSRVDMSFIEQVDIFDGRQIGTRREYFPFSSLTAWYLGYLFYNSSPPIFDIVMSLKHSKWRQITVIRSLGGRRGGPANLNPDCGYWYPPGFRDICEICIAFVAREHYPNKLEHTSATGILFGFVRHLNTLGLPSGAGREDELNWMGKNPIRKQILGAVVNFDGALFKRD